MYALNSFDLSKGDQINCVVQPDNPPDNSKGGLWITNWVGAKNIAELKKLKIGAVLTALPSSISRNQDYVTNGIVQWTVDCQDDPKCKIKHNFNSAYKFIDDNLQKTNVMIHCAAGISRSSSFLSMYLIKKNHITFEKALEMIQKARPMCYPNTGFRVELKEWQHECGISD